MTESALFRVASELVTWKAKCVHPERFGYGLATSMLLDQPLERIEHRADTTAFCTKRHALESPDDER
jgi:hypothetical protein